MLKTNEYHGDAYRKHMFLGEKVKLTEVHFARWLSIFHAEAFKYLPEQAAQLIVYRANIISESLKIGSISK